MTAIFEEQPADWTRSTWLQWRRQGVGGSDVAAIAGLSTYASPVAVFYDKLGLAREQPDNEAMQWGRLLEAPIAAEFEQRTGLRVVCPQVLVWDDEHPHRRATLDGLVHEHGGWEADEPLPPIEEVLGDLEIKTTRDAPWVDVPDRVLIQKQWQLGVCGFDHGWIAVLHGGQRLEIHEVDFDPVAYDALCRIADRFWTEHVLAENPPPADSNPATTETLKAVFGDRADGSTVVFDDSFASLPIEWLGAKADLKRAEARVALVENELRAALGEATFAADPDGTELVSWKPQSSGARLDAKRLKADHPDLAAEYTPEPGVTRVLRATKALKQLAGVDA